jgi:hypothetical protein
VRAEGCELGAVGTATHTTILSAAPLLCVLWTQAVPVAVAAGRCLSSLAGLPQLASWTPSPELFEHTRDDGSDADDAADVSPAPWYARDDAMLVLQLYCCLPRGDPAETLEAVAA